VLRPNFNGSISVIIPAFNSAGTIGRALDSVIAQSHRAHEIIVVNDGSADNTCAVVRRYGAGVCLIDAPHGGASLARNRGIEASTGEWIAFLDADDHWKANKLYTQLRSAERENVDVVATGSVYVRAGRPYKALRPEGRGQMLQKLLKTNPINTSTLLLRRSAIESPPLRFPEGVSFGEDWQMWIELAARRGMLFIPDELVTTYRSDVNCTASVDVERFISSIKEMYDRLRAVPELEKVIVAMWPELQANVEYKRANYLYDYGAVGSARMALIKELFRKRAACDLQLIVKILFVPWSMRNRINSLFANRFARKQPEITY
jgi:glycosyltransferase involved in cell wall biosynthesis